MKIKPKLRFPEFDGEWEEKQLSAILEIGTGKSKVQSNESGKYNILGSTGIIGKSHTYDYEGDFILTARVGHYAGKLYKHAGKVNISDNTIYLFNFINKNFIYESLNAFKLEKLVFGSGQPLIKASDLKKLKIRVPVSKEQKKIGGFFSKLDRQIELEEQKLEKLEEQKKGYMQKIFSQELRFKDDNGNSYPDWSIKKIEDISKVNKGFTPNTKNDEYWDELNENWLSIAGMTQKYLYKGNKGITEKGASKHVKVDKDTLIMSFKLTLGKLAIVKEPIYTNEAICHFVWKESNVNTEYMYYYLNSINISTFGAQAVKGVTLNNDSINSIIVKLPVIQEQNKIAYFFNELDKLIRKQYAKIELLKQRKNGLLQKMFV
ncbi:restriction endonuclease subunit S [Staphylococcus sp. GDQ8D205P]|uniref:restriction endonuclease subunit S n=1 Tax=Staphylococcus sp. GDQ8D205P TaxID=2804095 RepID=UPI001FD92E15|nr:restriction endonuclease subunit S [Staphylococcus sp. GDQ8D205P]